MSTLPAWKPQQRKSAKGRTSAGCLATQYGPATPLSVAGGCTGITHAERRYRSPARPTAHCGLRGCGLPNSSPDHNHHLRHHCRPDNSRPSIEQGHPPLSITHWLHSPCLHRCMPSVHAWYACNINTHSGARYALLLGNRPATRVCTGWMHSLCHTQPAIKCLCTAGKPAQFPPPVPLLLPTRPVMQSCHKHPARY